jgi:hypothetical protein
VNEFLLFSSDEPGREVKATYIGQDVVRGIRVDKWRTCHIDRTRLITEKRIWSFAQRGVSMPSGVVSDLGVPVQAIINGSVLYENYTKRFEFDEVFNVLSYRPSLTELINRITPTRGVFCDGVQQDQLVSLTDVGINWPFRFNVRVEASTSRSVEWQRFHLYYHRGDDDSSSRLRYDYLPQGSEDYQSVIHDYTDNLTYTIDRRIGTCKINRGVEVPDVNPLIDPIRFFIKNEAIFIYRPPEKAWENKRTRCKLILKIKKKIVFYLYFFLVCRTGSVQCTVLTTQADNFPNIIEPDTGLPSGETWNKTAIEYSWAMRAPDRSPTNRTRRLDYPVSLYLKMYRYQDSSLLNVNTEDVEYEFYEMSYDENLNQFDVSLCYRSLNYEYLHLGFILDIDGESKTIDRNNLNRFQLERDVHYNLINRMQIRYSRITDLEIDHESTDRYISVYFTLLGRTPNPESESGFYDDEPTAEEARDILKQVIDDEQFEFDMTLRDGSQIRFRASTKSLSTSKQFMNTHVFGKQITLQSYTSISLGLAIGVGLLAGLVAGILVAAVIRIVRKKPMPSLPSTITNPLPTINFRSEKTTKTTSDA